MGEKSRVSPAIAPSDFAPCEAGLRRHPLSRATHEMRLRPTEFSELQAQQQFQVLFIAGQRLAQLTLEILVAAAVQLRAELGDGALVKGNLLHDEIGSGT